MKATASLWVNDHNILFNMYIFHELVIMQIVDTKTGDLFCIMVILVCPGS